MLLATVSPSPMCVLCLLAAVCCAACPLALVSVPCRVLPCWLGYGRAVGVVAVHVYTKGCKSCRVACHAYVCARGLDCAMVHCRPTCDLER